MRPIEFRAWSDWGDGGDPGYIENTEDFRLYNLSNPDGVIFEQFTALLDRNGVKIFEGDIVRYENRKYKVMYRDRYCDYCLMHHRWKWKGIRLYLDIMSKCKVIGNIHEHAHLLEAKP
jgi:uncharacterized phage protein (TIGR01671 family)